MTWVTPTPATTEAAIVPTTVLADASLAPGTTWTRNTSGLWILQASRNFPTAIADAKANPPSGWTWYDNGLVGATATVPITSAVVASNKLSGYTAAGTTNLWWGSGQLTAPVLYKSYTRNTLAGQEWIARCACSLTGNTSQFFGLLIFDPVTPTLWARFCLQSAGAGKVLQGAANVDTTGITGIALTDAQAIAGVWVRLVIDSTGTVWAYYNLADQATPPTTWTYHWKRQDWAMNAGLTLYAGMLFNKQQAVTEQTADLLYYDDTGATALVSSAANPSNCGGGFATSTVLYLVQARDLTGLAVTNAQLQSALGAITNRFTSDTATVEFYATRAAADDPTGTYRSAATAVWEGTGDLAWIRCRVTTTGTQPGSLAVDALRMLALVE